MNNPAIVTPVQLHADHARETRLGNWTTARAFQVRARHAQLTIDLRSPQIPAGDIDVGLSLDHSMVKLLVADDAVIDHRDLTWTGRGKVKQAYRPRPGWHQPPDPPDRTGQSWRGPGSQRPERQLAGDRRPRLPPAGSREPDSTAHPEPEGE